MEVEQQQKTAIIVGGGPGGLLASIALSNIGYKVSLFERSPVFSQKGAALNFAPNGYSCLESLGMGDLFKKHGFVIEWFDGRQFNNAPLFDFNLKKHLSETAKDRPYLTLRRSQVHQILLDYAQKQCKVNVFMDEKFVEYTQFDDGVEVEFVSGKKVKGAILVGADGIHSAVRKQLEEENVKRGLQTQITTPSYRGYTVWRGIATNYIWPGASGTHMIVVGPPNSNGCRLFFADMGAGKYYWFWCKLSPQGVHEDDYSEAKERIIEEMKNQGFHISFWKMVENTDASEIDKRDIFELPTLPTWSNGRVVLVGDSCHAMTPENGQGTSMAAEDAVCLANCLNQNTSIEESLQKYESIRKPRTTFVASKARFNGNMLSLQNSYMCWLRTQVFSYFGEKIMKSSTPIWSYHMDEESRIDVEF